MRVIGLTGGIASGKSTVSKYLSKTYGVTVIDADKTARALAEKGAPLWEAYKARYGEKILLPDGNLDRGAVAETVFHSPEEKKWMDETSHPMIKKRFLEEFSAAKSRGESALLLDVPLLFEAGWEDLADEVWVVYVDEDTEVKRLMKRNGLPEDEARARIAAQMPLEEKRNRADVVIDNRGSKEDAMRQVDAAFSRAFR